MLRLNKASSRYRVSGRNIYLSVVDLRVTSVSRKSSNWMHSISERTLKHAKRKDEI